MKAGAIPSMTSGDSLPQALFLSATSLGAGLVTMIAKKILSNWTGATLHQAMSTAASHATVEAEVKAASKQIAKGAVHITHELSVRFGLDQKVLDTAKKMTKWIVAGKLIRAFAAPSSKQDEKGGANWPLRLGLCGVGYAAWKYRNPIQLYWSVIRSVV